MNIKNKENKYKAVIAVAVALAFLLPGSAVIGNNESGSTFGGTRVDTIVSISPSSQTVEKGETFTVSVYVEPGEPILGINVDYLYFDETLINTYPLEPSLDSVTFEGFFNPFPAINSKAIFVLEVDNTLGEIRNVFEGIIGDGNVSTPGYFVNISFTAQDEDGISLLELDGVIVSDTAGEPVPITVNNGEVIVSSPTFTLDGYCTYDGSIPVDPLTVKVTNLNTETSWDADTTSNYYSLVLDPATDVSVNDVLRIIARDNTNYVKVIDHTVTQNEIDAGGVTIDLILDVYYLDLKDFPMYLAESITRNENQMCGPAVIQMTSNYINWNSSQYPEPPMTYDDQSEIYNDAHAHNSNTTLSYLDAQGLCWAVNDYRPDGEYGYNFGLYNGIDATDMLYCICYWIDYPAGIVEGYPVNVPGAIPAYGDYSNWMAVRGIHTNRSVFLQPSENVTVHGLWVNDPFSSGIGENTYKTADEFTSNYYKPLDFIDENDDYYGRYVAVCEPPEDIEFGKLTYAPQPVRLSQLQSSTLNRLETRVKNDLSVSIEELKQAYGWIEDAAEDALRELGKIDQQVADLDISPYEVIHVEDDLPYYIVTFKPNNQIIEEGFIVCAVIVDGTGTFQELSLSDPVKLFENSESEMIEIARKELAGVLKPTVKLTSSDLSSNKFKVKSTAYTHYGDSKYNIAYSIVFITDVGDIEVNVLRDGTAEITSFNVESPSVIPLDSPMWPFTVHVEDKIKGGNIRGVQVHLYNKEIDTIGYTNNDGDVTFYPLLTKLETVYITVNKDRYLPSTCSVKAVLDLPPIAIGLSSVDADVNRTQKATVISNAIDNKDKEDNLRCEMEYRSPSGNWTSMDTEFVTDHWKASFTPTITAEVGLYDFRVRYCDSSDLWCDWYMVEDNLEVSNNPPVIFQDCDDFVVVAGETIQIDLIPFGSDIEEPAGDLWWWLNEFSINHALFGYPGISFDWETRIMTISTQEGVCGTDDITLELYDNDWDGYWKTDVTITVIPDDG